jgi:hypothetical protein
MATATESLKYNRPVLYPKQAAFVDCPARYAIVEASTKTGKTVGCLVWLFEQALKGRPSQNFYWVAPTYTVAGIAFGRLKRWLRESGLPRNVWQANEGDQNINIGDRIIWFKGADNPDMLYGDDVAAAVIDEATRCKEEAWHAVRSTLTNTQGPVKIIGNVRGRKNWAYQLARKAQGGEENFAYFKLTAWDAVEGGVLPREEVDDAKRALPEHVFRELYLAEPADDGGNPFGIQAIAKCVAPMSMEPAIAFGVDLAKSVDWTAIIGLDDLGSVCVLERFQSDWQQTSRRVLHEIQNVATYADSTGVGDPIVEMLQRRSGNVSGFKFTSQSKQQLMEGLAAAIQQNEVAFPDGWLRSELESFEYEYTRTGMRYSAPEGLHDDGVCALALAVQCRQKSGKPWERDDVEAALDYGSAT